ncbi:MAG: 16S rRNA (guanine(966)-N(2))-methyltransferase RsmD [Pseudomonadota bacterium]
MRIIAGQFKGRALSAPSTQTIRPTSDRLRETLFNILAHGYGDGIEGKRVLDLFAGTGALGIEALSRGASFCLFVDQGVEARGLIRTNTDTFGLNGITKIYKRDATSLGENLTSAPFDLVFCDPPYDRGLAELALASAMAGNWLAKNALVVVEESAQAVLQVPDNFTQLDQREAGDSALYFLRFNGG